MAGDKIIKPNVHIEFQILKDSSPEDIKEEFEYIIGLGRFITVWSKLHSPEEMLHFAIQHDLQDLIWDYKRKDSFYYSSVDFIIDNDKRLVDRFIRNGKQGNYVERIG